MLGLLLISLSGTSCMLRDSRCTNLMGNGQYCLQSTAAVAPFTIRQIIKASINSNHETAVTDIEVNAQGMSLIVLTPFGQKIMHINYDNKEANAIASTSSRIAPSMLIAIVQLALWPAASVRDGLSDSLLLEENISHRRYLAKNKLVLDIQYANSELPYNKLHISIPTINLELDIEALPEIDGVQ